MKGRTRKAVSPVVASVMLVLLAVTLVIIIARFAIPFVKESLYGSGDCFKANEELKIDVEEGYACYYLDVAQHKVKITIKRGTGVAVNRFMLVVSGEGNSDSFVIQGGEVEGVTMLDGTTSLQLPKPGERKTYILSVSNRIDYAEVVPIVKGGKLCSASDKAEIKEC